MDQNHKYNLSNFIRNVTQKNEIKNLLVAISGGQDSVLLMKLINEIYTEHEKKILKISYIYVDHQWKNNSYNQIKHLINYTKSLKQKIAIYQIQKATISENKCREQRYNIIQKHAIKYGFEVILTGHNASDKTETFFNNINRGCGIEGMTSTTITNQINGKILIIKPLINIFKKEIYWLCKKLYLPIWSDNTNYVNEVTRNRIRHELIPYMENFMNNKIEKNILSLLKNYYYENEYIKQSISKMYLKIKHKEKIAINYNILKKQHLILQIKTIQLFCMHNFNTYFENKDIAKIIGNLNNKIYRSNNLIIKKKNFIYKVNNKWIYIQIKQLY
uniref:tRNA(Ile)-lysidine synthase, chloroplastic n=1 Tax=Tolypiocladia glomerulata TaxID=860646 RepID=A0A1Z1MV19_9FLOR|nr:tRNA Ile-lysidine synthetase [Tolypiocladia glomerulata]ARW69682.1 tRNA Ile-lysidine synthetase [Tolypiocladia glomerulata]